MPHYETDADLSVMSEIHSTLHNHYMVHNAKNRICAPCTLFLVVDSRNKLHKGMLLKTWEGHRQISSS